MYKMQIFQDALAAVVEETGIESRQILSGAKEEEVVDARSILIEVMYECGLYPVQISVFTGICPRSVNRFLAGFYGRCAIRTLMRINYDNVKTKLGL